jgi:hypothetical protein
MPWCTLGPGVLQDPECHWAHCLWGSGHGLSPHEAAVVSAQLAALGFTKVVFGLEPQRLADANTIEKLCERYAGELETLGMTTPNQSETELRRYSERIQETEIYAR